MLKEEMEWVKEVARQIAKEEIALALKMIKPEAKFGPPEPAEKIKTPEPAAEEVKADAPKKGK